MIKSRAMVAGILAGALGIASTAHAQGWQPQQGQRDYQHQYQHQHDSQTRTSPQWQGHRQWQGQPQWQGRSEWQGQHNYAPQYQSRSWGGYRGGYAAYAHPNHFRAYDWRARHLAAPPYGYRWVENDSGDVLLMALATGLIANAIVNSAAAPAAYYQAPAPYYQAPNYQPYGEAPYPY